MTVARKIIPRRSAVNKRRTPVVSLPEAAAFTRCDGREFVLLPVDDMNVMESASDLPSSPCEFDSRRPLHRFRGDLHSTTPRISIGFAHLRPGAAYRFRKRVPRRKVRASPPKSIEVRAGYACGSAWIAGRFTLIGWWAARADCRG